MGQENKMPQDKNLNKDRSTFDKNRTPGQGQQGNLQDKFRDKSKTGQTGNGQTGATGTSRSSMSMSRAKRQIENNENNLKRILVCCHGFLHF